MCAKDIKVGRTYIVGLNGAEGEVLCRYGHLGECIEQGTFPDIGKPHNPNLHNSVVGKWMSRLLAHIHVLAFLSDRISASL